MDENNEVQIEAISGLIMDKDIKENQIPIAQNLFLIKDPLYRLDNSWKSVLGEPDLSDARSTCWGFKYICKKQGNLNSNIDEDYDYKAEEANEFKIGILGLWITKPTGAHITYRYSYTQKNGTEESSNPTLAKYLDIFHPLPSYEFQSFQTTDITIFKNVFAGIKNIIDQNKSITLSLRYLSSALYLGFFEPRFVLFTSVLESLFTNNNTEISHKISERVAFFLEEDPNKREDLFFEMKKIYDIRSSIVHGSGWSKRSIEEIDKLTTKLEFIVQRILKKIVLTPELVEIFSINIKSEDTKNREKYLTRMLFKG